MIPLSVKSHQFLERIICQFYFYKNYCSKDNVVVRLAIFFVKLTLEKTWFLVNILSVSHDVNDSMCLLLHRFLHYFSGPGFFNSYNLENQVQNSTPNTYSYGRSNH